MPHNGRQKALNRLQSQHIGTGLIDNHAVTASPYPADPDRELHNSRAAHWRRACGCDWLCSKPPRTTSPRYPRTHGILQQSPPLRTHQQTRTSTTQRVRPRSEPTASVRSVNQTRPTAAASASTPVTSWQHCGRDAHVATHQPSCGQMLKSGDFRGIAKATLGDGRRSYNRIMRMNVSVPFTGARRRGILARHGHSTTAAARIAWLLASKSAARVSSPLSRQHAAI